ncbi:OmpH/Skp family outer membrane protein [Aureisphaera sp.]
MKKLALPLALIALIISVISLFDFTSDSELVYVDVNKLMEGYERTAVERSLFEEKSQKMKANVDSLIGNWQEELKTYEKERSSMSRKEIELKQELLANKQQQIGNYQQAIQKQIQDEDQKATQTVVNDINDYVKEYGEKKGYKIIFGASGAGNIMYADTMTDLTEEVLVGLNEEYKGTE